MRVKFTHPVIITGRNADASPRAELCRVESAFEIPEYTWDEAPVAMVASHASYPSDYFHRVGGKLFKALPDALEYGHFDAENLLSYKLHNGDARSIQFEPFHETVSRAAARIEDDSGYALRVKIKRDLLKREAKVNMREVTKACINAPMLRKWNWLSPDADAEIEAWRAIAAEKIANVALIKGVPAIRAFEPCYVLTARYGTPQIQVASKHVYARQIHVTDTQIDGLEALGPDAGELRTHYFAASDYDEAAEFAQSIGWHLLPSSKPGIHIRNDLAVTDDFEILEAMRHGRILLSATDGIVLHNRARAVAAGPANVDPRTEELIAGAKSLKDEVISWQNSRQNVDGVRSEIAHLADLVSGFERSPVGVPGHARHSTLPAELNAQMGQFLARSDRSDISLNVPMATSRAP